MSEQQTKLINSQIETELGKLVAIELTASHIYHYISMWCDNAGYFGAKKWYQKQSEEEKEHAQKVMNYISDRNGCVIMPTLPNIIADFKTLRDVLERTLVEEIKVETAWKEFACLCMEDKDLTSFTFAQWYLNEQIAEISKVNDYIATLNVLGDTGISYIMMDQILGA